MRQLSTDEIIACARGHRQVRHATLGLELLRFSDSELAYYSARGDAALVRACCPAGVTLAARTDSKALTLTLRFGASARPMAFADLYVDGYFTGTLGSTELVESLTTTFALPRAGEEAEVLLYLPHMRETGIAALAVDDGARWEPAPPRGTLLALGDSITQGMVARQPSQGWPMTAARLLDLTLDNRGVGGHVFDAAGLPEPPANCPSLVTIAYGTNDWNQGRDMQEARPYLARVRALYPDTPTAVLAPIWWQGNDGVEPAPTRNGHTLAAYRRDLAAIVADFPGMAFLAMPRLLPPGPTFLPDNIHPDTAGHAIMGAHVARQLAGMVSGCAADPAVPR